MPISYRKCVHCDGTGIIVLEHDPPFLPQQVYCRGCHGTGVSPYPDFDPLEMLDAELRGEPDSREPDAG